MTDDELKVTRRSFLEQSAGATAMSAAWYSIAMKTDALAQAPGNDPVRALTTGPGPSPYAYDEEDPH